MTDAASATSVELGRLHWALPVIVPPALSSLLSIWSSAPEATSRALWYQRTVLPPGALYSYSIAVTPSILNGRMRPGAELPEEFVRSCAMGVVPSSSRRAVICSPVPAARTITG